MIEITVKKLLENPVIINVGLEKFFEDNLSQNIKTTQVNWRPPAGGDKELQRILSKIL